jgi:transcriptional regulator with XRE-family HTH domain
MAAEAEQSSPQETARQNIPTVVRTLMQWRRVTRAQVMTATGMSKPTLSERLSGKSPFKDYELLALADLLDVDPGVFFRSPEALISSRCYLEIVPSVAGQLELALDARPQLVAV